MKNSLENKIQFVKTEKHGGYRNLLDFEVNTLESKANEVIEVGEMVLVPEKDIKVFFEALMNPPSPNDMLKAARIKFDNFISK
jgi:uncharacterized protein (DUF1778 family)